MNKHFEELRTFTNEEIAETQAVFIKAIIDNEIDDELALNALMMLCVGNLAKSPMTESDFQEVLHGLSNFFNQCRSESEAS